MTHLTYGNSTFDNTAFLLKLFSSREIAVALAAHIPLSLAQPAPVASDKSLPEFNTPAYWYESGPAALKEIKRNSYVGTKAKNVILFVGDGMAILIKDL